MMIREKKNENKHDDNDDNRIRKKKSLTGRWKINWNTEGEINKQMKFEH